MEFIIILVGQLLTFLTLVLSTKLLTNLLSVSDFGSFSFALILMSLISQIIFGFILAAQTRMRHETKNVETRNTNFSFLLVISISCILTLSIILALSSIKNIYIYIFIFLNFQSLNMYLNAINNADRKRLKVAVINILEGVLKVFFLYYVYINSITINAEQAILIFMSACITAFLFNIFILSKNLLETFKIKKLLISLVYIKRVVNYGFPISLNSILYWLQNSGDKFLINTLKGPSTLGSYAIVYQYGYTTVMMIFDIINSYITPIVFQKYSENNNRNHKLYVIKVAAICLPLSIIFVSIMYLFKQDIILLVSNKEYLVYANYLPILSICAIFYCYSQLITLINHAEKRVVEVSKKKIQIIFLSIIFYIPMTYYYGINGLLFIIFVSNISLFLTAIYYAFFKKFRYSF